MSRCWLDVPYLLRRRWFGPGLQCNYLCRLSLMTRDLSWLTLRSACCSRMVPGGLRFERMLRRGGSTIVPKEVSNSKVSRKEVQVHP